VGRTRFELVTSSVSGKSRAAPGVCHRRTESDEEPPTCENILSTSRWVWGPLNVGSPFWLPLIRAKRPASAADCRLVLTQRCAVSNDRMVVKRSGAMLSEWTAGITLSSNALR
jgi:hypothetical protein